MALDKLVDSTQLDGAMTATANAIRGKTGDSNTIAWDLTNGFKSAVEAIPSGGTANIQANKTATPSASQQIIQPDSGYDALGQVTVNGISPTKAAQTYTPTTSNQVIQSGRWLSGDQTILGDANLIAGNIKNGVSIFGVTGSYEGSGGEIYHTIITSDGVSGEVYPDLDYERTIISAEFTFIDNNDNVIIGAINRDGYTSYEYEIYCGSYDTGDFYVVYGAFNISSYCVSGYHISEIYDITQDTQIDINDNFRIDIFWTENS